MMRNNGFPDSNTVGQNHLVTIAEKRSDPGIIVLSVDLHLVYINSQATELCTKLRYYNNRDTQTEYIPSCIHAFGNKVCTILRGRSQDINSQHIQIKELIGDSRCTILLRGFGVPAPSGQDHWNIIITMEKAERRLASLNEKVKVRYKLTNREETVVQFLAKGLTNKQIANSMCITEQTVKQHIKHIMHKTKASTRTGILAKLLIA